MSNNVLLSQREARRRIENAMAAPAEKFSLARALLAMESAGGLSERSSFEGEFAAAAARAEGRKHDPSRIRVPFEILARDLTAASGPAAGYLIDTDMAPALQMLRPYSVTTQAGANVQTGLQGDRVTPKIIGRPTAHWLSSESTSTTESNATIGQSAFTPKGVSAYFECSRLLLLQGMAAESTIAAAAAQAVSIALDRAALVGTGSAGEPLGIINVPGIGAAAGSALSWADLLSLRASAVETIGNDQRISWIGGTVAQRILAGRERAAGSGFCWDYNHAARSHGQIAGHDAYATNACPNDALFLGDWSQLVVGIWGDSVEIAVNPYANFQEGIVGFRVTLWCDVGVTTPAYFSAVTSIT